MMNMLATPSRMIDIIPAMAPTQQDPNVPLQFITLFLLSVTFYTFENLLSTQLIDLDLSLHTDKAKKDF